MTKFLLKKKVWRIAAWTTLAVAGVIYLALQWSGSITPRTPQPIEDTPAIPPRIEYGLQVDSFEVDRQVVGKGETFGLTMQRYGIGYPKLQYLVDTAKTIFDIRTWAIGKKYTVFYSRDSVKRARYLIYETDPVNFVVFDVDRTKVYRDSKPLTVKRRTIAASINSSLFEALDSEGVHPELAVRLADIYAWTVDFFHVQKEDYFKVIFEEKYIEDTIYAGTGRIIAAQFHHRNRDFYAFHFQDSTASYRDYFDEEGNTLRKAFLKAPLNFFRISSRYGKRFHPVLKRMKAHLGTDYAAPTGTPIMTTANGVIERAGYTSGNGNYVKVKHNSVYTTQYLHMSRIAKGIRPGVAVRQGDVIGYVGSTGLATGPHVCYRFWKNGKQVDPLKEDLPHAEPIENKYRESYQALMMPLKTELDTLKVSGLEPRRLASAQ